VVISPGFEFCFLSNSQKIGWEEHLQNDLFLCGVGCKSLTQSISGIETSSYYFECASCCQQVHVNSKMLLQQNPPVLNCGCWLTQVALYNGHKTAVVIVISFSRQRKRVVVIQNLSRVYGCGHLSCKNFLGY